MKSLLAIASVSLLAGAAAAETLTVASAPPVVVQTLPAAGSRDVASGVTEIRVVFSKEMMTERMWSVVKASADTFPELAGDVRYLDDARTFVIPVRLEGGRTYALWLNTAERDAFRDASGRPAVPYLLVFQTKK
jgi:hypothetical protein